MDPNIVRNKRFLSRSNYFKNWKMINIFLDIKIENHHLIEEKQ